MANNYRILASGSQRLPSDTCQTARIPVRITFTLSLLKWQQTIANFV